MKTQRKIINIDEALCNGCGQCLPACPEQAIQLVDTPDGPKARLVKEIFCDGLGACLGNCPTGALTITEREADAYNDVATVARIKEVAPELLETHRKHLEEHAAAVAALPSELRQWPVQLHLVSPNAPYFKHANLVICADCVPFAYANFHQDFLKGEENAIAVGCPKLDDTQAYLEKLTQMFASAQPKSMTIVNMEVPCCFGLVRLVQQAMEASGQSVPVKTVTIGIRGEKLS